MPRKFDFISPGIELTEIDNSVLPPARDNDGPIIIGRTRKGPALKPVKIRSLDDYIAVFGRPNAGGSSPSGDLWRDGAGASAPTYASYAAQAWLAGGTAPINVVRLLGAQHSSISSGDSGEAGWKLSGSKAATRADNSSAYGLFIVDKASIGNTTKGILNITSFDVTHFGDDNNESAVLSFFHKASLSATPSIAAADGLVFQINFDNDEAAGSIVKLENAGGSGATGLGRAQTGGEVSVYSIGIDEASDTQTTIMGYIESAISQAIANGDISDISVDNNGTSLTIHNLSSTKEFNMADKGAAGSYTGGGNAANFDFSANGTSSDLNNSYGVELAVATAGVGTGALAAIFYADKGTVELKGNLAKTSGTGASTTATCALIDSDAADIGFTLVVKDENDTVKETTPFNFNRNSGNYIRKVFNTNPTLTNSRTTPSNELKTYWLGETFERHLKTYVTSTTSTNQYGVLLPLESGSVNWADRKEGYAEAGSGWVIANYNGDQASFDITKQSKMFRFAALQEGEDLQKNVFISIENLNLPPNPEVYAYSTFDVVVRSVDGNALERFSNLVMDENNSNYIARQIGDMYQDWDNSKKRYRMYGDYPNNSDYIRAIMPDIMPSNEAALPFGFLGPAAPKGFGILGGDASVKTFDLSADFAGAFVENGDAGDSTTHTNDFIKHDLTNPSIKFAFPKLKLRENGTQGSPSNPYQAMYGIRPKISDNSNLHDSDYCDYVRGLPALSRAYNFTPSGDFEHSITFSLDELVIDEDQVTVVYTEGSHKLGTAYRSSGNSTAKKSGTVEDLLNLGVSNFAMPLFGGFDGLDITEIEPFNNDLMNSSDTDVGNYLANSFNLAASSVSDEEVVPANLILAPGFKKPHLTNRLISIADTRQDVLAVIDLEGDYKPNAEADTTDSKASRRGTVKDAVTKLKTRNIDSSFACTFYPWIQITDRLGGSELVWVPPSVAALGAMARSDSLADVWFAPAGFNRGGLGSLGGPAGPTVVQARQRLDAKDRDDLYAVGINPIASFPNEGVVVFGQKTLQQRQSALDRINVRRLMLYLKREIGQVAQNTLFQNNVPATWADFKGRAEPILSDVKNRFGLTDYKLILDETTTTPDLIDRNILYAKVFLKPARAIEYIAIDFVITKTGADFV